MLLVIYEVLDIASKENRPLAKWTMGSFIARVAVQNVMCDIFREVAAFCALMTFVCVVAMFVPQVVFQILLNIEMFIAKDTIFRLQPMW